MTTLNGMMDLDEKDRRTPSRILSTFLQPSPTTNENALAMLHLKKDSLLPITLRSNGDEGYAEGAVTNTRFGSFPHSTLLGLEWGSQVRASKVDTGTRGRKKKNEVQPTEPLTPQDEPTMGGVDSVSGRKKRKSDEMQPEPSASPTKKTKLPPPTDETGMSSPKPPQAAVEAGSGFVHILQPTPEAWTSSLDHRTQVVYTPDYSYVLQRLRVRPGSTIIEAGAGSGSFTHAAARAIFNGYTSSTSTSTTQTRKLGQVCSYEYHKPRVQTLKEELSDHGLDGVVSLTHRDVCNDGFTLADQTSQPKADAVFLDLPAPWLALKHLTRSGNHSPLNPHAAVHICTFSPCIEQVMTTVTDLRKLGWTDITMTEVQNHRIDVRRERIGLKEEGLRGVNASAATVDEAVNRLREVETKLSDFHANKDLAKEGGEVRKVESKQDRLARIKREQEGRKVFKEGNLVHRTEPEVKTHTSYLVFATLPREWSEEDEAACAEKWPLGDVMASAGKEGKS